jgi:hypothetical protein
LRSENRVRYRWFGATGRKVPQVAVEGDPAVPLEDALVLDDVRDAQRLREAHEEGTPVVVRAATVEDVVAALGRPEVSAVVVPKGRRDLVDLDLVTATYGH